MRWEGGGARAAGRRGGRAGWPTASKPSGWHLSPLPRGLGPGLASSLPYLPVVYPVSTAAPSRQDLLTQGTAKK